MRQVQLILFIALACLWLVPAGAAEKAGEIAAPALDVSLVLEVQASLRRGANFLVSRQQPNGSWANHSVITSLSTMALANSPYRDEPRFADAIERALDYLAAQAKPDGAIWTASSRQYPLYSTAISMFGLIRMQREKDLPALHRARQYLFAAQVTDGATDAPEFGGFVDPRDGHPTLTTSQWVLEALYLSDFLDDQPETAERARDAYARATQFISRCQRLEKGAVHGAFADFPVSAEAGQGRAVRAPGTPRSNMFLTCAGLKSLLYSRVPRDDPRVSAASKYLARNYTVKENPGCEQAGVYTYLFTFTQALRALKCDLLPATDRFWRQDVVLELLRRQQGTGSWQQGRADWWENHPELVTAYGLLMLELAAAPELR